MDIAGQGRLNHFAANLADQVRPRPCQFIAEMATDGRAVDGFAGPAQQQADLPIGQEAAVFLDPIAFAVADLEARVAEHAGRTAAASVIVSHLGIGASHVDKIRNIGDRIKWAAELPRRPI